MGKEQTSGRIAVFHPDALRLETTRTTRKNNLEEMRGLTRPRTLSICFHQDFELNCIALDWTMGTGELARAPKASCFKRVVSNQREIRRKLRRCAPDTNYHFFDGLHVEYCDTLHREVNPYTLFDHKRVYGFTTNGRKRINRSTLWLFGFLY